MPQRYILSPDRVFGRTDILILLAVYIQSSDGGGGSRIFFNPSSRCIYTVYTVYIFSFVVFLYTCSVESNARCSRCRYEQNDDGNQRQRSQRTRRQRTHSSHNHIFRFSIDHFGRPGEYQLSS